MYECETIFWVRLLPLVIKIKVKIQAFADQWYHQVKMPLISKGSDFGKSEDKLPLDSLRRQSTN